MDEKVCSKCGVPRPLSEFSLHSPSKQDGRLRPDCKICVRRRGSARHEGNKEVFNSRIKLIKAKAKAIAQEYIRQYLLDHPCVDCGESDPDVLDFDHVRGEKVCDVSRMVHRGYRLWRIKAEIEKCEVRCANDHRRKTRGRNSIGRVQGFQP